VHRLPPPFDRFTTQLRYRSKQFIGRHPWLYRAIFRNRSGFEDLLVDEETDICIEGFPRSANSFAVAAFRHAQDEPVGIAHHNHVPAPVLTAVRRGIPTIVLIRDPVEAVMLFRGLLLQIAAANGEENAFHISYALRLKAWISFYETIKPVADRIVIDPFEEVIDDFGGVIDRVNKRFGTAFARFHHTSATVDEVRGSHGYHALPSPQRDMLKQEARHAFEREIGDNHPTAQRAHRLFISIRLRMPTT
jgi:hypothetical protein